VVTNVLMSIHPKYAEAILRGTKRYELRRMRPQFPPGTLVWLYATKPRGAIVGCFESGQIISGPPQTMWRSIGADLGIESKAFRAYVAGCERVFAIEIRAACPAPSDLPMPAGLTPPQSYMYLPVQVDQPALWKGLESPSVGRLSEVTAMTWPKMGAMGSS
jgi:predicted transcriptional regulator